MASDERTYVCNKCAYNWTKLTKNRQPKICPSCGSKDFKCESKCDCDKNCSGDCGDKCKCKTKNKKKKKGGCGSGGGCGDCGHGSHI